MKKLIFAACMLLAAFSLSAQEQEEGVTYIAFSGGYQMESQNPTGALEFGIMYKKLIGGMNFSFYDKPINKLFLGLNLEAGSVSFMAGGAIGLSGYEREEEDESENKTKNPSFAAGGWGKIAFCTKCRVVPFAEYCKDYIFTTDEAKSRVSVGVKVFLW